ncbi:hypothetical protein ACLB2K_072916 [Fragaria x ananassa]
MELGDRHPTYLAMEKDHQCSYGKMLFQALQEGTMIEVICILSHIRNIISPPIKNRKEKKHPLKRSLLSSFSSLSANKERSFQELQWLQHQSEKNTIRLLLVVDCP